MNKFSQVPSGPFQYVPSLSLPESLLWIILFSDPSYTYCFSLPSWLPSTTFSLTLFVSLSCFHSHSHFPCLSSISLIKILKILVYSFWVPCERAALILISDMSVFCLLFILVENQFSLIPNSRVPFYASVSLQNIFKRWPLFFVTGEVLSVLSFLFFFYSVLFADCRMFPLLLFSITTKPLKTISPNLFKFSSLRNSTF